MVPLAVSRSIRPTAHRERLIAASRAMREAATALAGELPDPRDRLRFRVVSHRLADVLDDPQLGVEQLLAIAPYVEQSDQRQTLIEMVADRSGVGMDLLRQARLLLRSQPWRIPALGGAGA